MILPSKELLSEVLKANVTEVYERKGEIRFKTHTNRADGWFSSSDTPIPNIYELAHKCKNWAKKKEFIITSETNTYASYSYVGLDVLNGGFIKEFEADTEPEAIFKACEWIMEKTK